MIGFLLGAFCLQAEAQRINIGAGLGGFNYKGDLAPAFNPRNYLPGGNAFFRYNLSPAVSLRAGATLGIVGAQDSRSPDPFNQARNASFRSTIIEGSLITEYNFLNYSQKRKAKNWTPYLFGGLGFYKFMPRTKTSDYKNDPDEYSLWSGYKSGNLSARGALNLSLAHVSYLPITWMIWATINPSIKNCNSAILPQGICTITLRLRSVTPFTPLFVRRAFQTIIN